MTHLSTSRKQSETKASASFSAPLSPILLFSRLMGREREQLSDTSECKQREIAALRELECIFTLSAVGYVDPAGAPTTWEEPGGLSLDQAWRER